MRDREVEDILRRYRPAGPRPRLRTRVAKTGDSGIAARQPQQESNVNEASHDHRRRRRTAPSGRNGRPERPSDSVHPRLFTMLAGLEPAAELRPGGSISADRDGHEG